MDKNKKIYIAGHNGMVGSALWKYLEAQGYLNILGKSRNELDLTNQNQTNEFFKKNKPDVVINAAAKVGGIMANNNYPYQFLMQNMQIQNNLIDASLNANVEKFIFLGSSCIYPKFAPQPLKEDYLLTDSLESTNQWYAIAKISGIKLCQAIRKQFGKDYVSLMPTNLYGYNDNFDIESSHVLPAMIRKFHDAKINNHSDVILWGSGTPMREFLFVDDLAEATVFLLENELKYSIYNIGSGIDISITDLANIVKKIVGHKGNIVWDKSKPDGTPRKLLDVSRMRNMGWSHKVKLEQGIEKTYNWFKENYENFKEIKL